MGVCVFLISSKQMHDWFVSADAKIPNFMPATSDGSSVWSSPKGCRIRKTPQKALKPTKNYYYSDLLIAAEGRDTYIEVRAEIFLFAKRWLTVGPTDSYIIDKRRSLPRSYSCCSVMLTIHLHLMLKVRNDWRHTSKTRAILCLDIIIICTNYIISTTITIITVNWRIKNQLDATWYFIVLLIGSTCFKHYYAHHQELATMFTTLAVSFLVCCMLEVMCSCVWACNPDTTPAYRT